MNDIQARARPTYGGWHGEIRKVHKADFEKVCRRPGMPLVFATEAAALIAAHEALLRHIRGSDMLRWSEPISVKDGAEIEKVFGHTDLIRNGKRIPVIRR
jgi:hypothetical protein